MLEKKMKKILIIGHDSFHNKGCQALIYSTTRMLSDALPGAVFKVFSWDPDYDALRFKQRDIRCEFVRHKFQINEFSPRNRFWLFLNGTLKLRTERALYAPAYFYNAINWADLIVVSGGDILADYGDEAVKHYFFPIAVGIAVGKPVYVFAQSISNYNNPKLRRFCKKYLDRVSLITVREQLSYDYMKALGIKVPLHLTADPAFTLEPCSQERLDEIVLGEEVPTDAELLIGFSVSKTVTRWGGGTYEKFMVEFCTALDAFAVSYPKVRFVFIPHVTYSDDPKNDDRLVAREISRRASRKHHVCLVEGDYDCQESKGLIGLCDLFVGARTHATIASSSQLIPTIALAYSTKAFGIMKEVLDQDRCVLDVRDFNADNLLSKAAKLLDDRDQVVSEMQERLYHIREASLQNAVLAKELFL